MINKERKEELIKMGYEKLQSTKEYKEYTENYIYSHSRLMNEEIEFILQFENGTGKETGTEPPFTYENIENQYYYRFEDIKQDLETEVEELDDKTDTEKQEILKDLKVLIDCEDLDELKDFCINNLLSSDFDEYEEPQEIMQWFLMDERIIRQLNERGEPTLNDKYWGRCCFGQMIDMDSVIVNIFKEWYLNLYGVIEK